MKKILLRLLGVILLVGISFIAASCSSDDSGGGHKDHQHGGGGCGH